MSANFLWLRLPRMFIHDPTWLLLGFQILMSPNGERRALLCVSDLSIEGLVKDSGLKKAQVYKLIRIILSGSEV